MLIRETFYRSPELKREHRTLPAETYNSLKLIHYFAREQVIFIPVRSLQYLAVMDHDEVIFLDGAVSRNIIVISWQRFRPSERNRLDQPVGYEVVYHSEEVLGIMGRLQSEFNKAVHHYDQKLRKNLSADIIPIRP